MFQPDSDTPSQSAGVLPNGGAPTAVFGSSPNSAHAMQSLNPSSPFAAATPLFKTTAGESVSAVPIQHSPFSATATDATCLLTVGDVLPQLPPEIARMNGLSPDQPVVISAQLLDAALRSGQAALPIFEIYRVCPALFLTPISPQDPRMIPLPAAKLPRLIASTQQVATGFSASAATPASPFGTMPAGAMSPFAIAQQPQTQGPATTSLPPRRSGPPPPLADVPARDTSLALPGQTGHGAPAFPMSPFAAAGTSISQPESAPSSPPSPFSARPPESSAPQMGGGLFSPKQEAPTPAQPVTPLPGFGAPTAPASAPSPFGTLSASPPPAGESPFSTLFGNKAVTTGQPAPDATPRFGVAQSVPVMPAMTMTATPSSTSMVRISLASLLRGYTVAELGFDPVMVPAWIMTSLPGSMVQEWAGMPTPLAELGTLVDGITDVGFRNVLNNAKRDFQVRLPPQELSNALSGNPPPSLPNLASLSNAAAPAFAAGQMRVESTGAGASPFGAMMPHEQTTPSPASAFQPQHGFGRPESSSPAVPLFSVQAPQPQTAPFQAPTSTFSPPPAQPAAAFAPPPVQAWTPAPASHPTPVQAPAQDFSPVELMSGSAALQPSFQPPIQQSPVSNPFAAPASSNPHFDPAPPAPRQENFQPQPPVSLQQEPQTVSEGFSSAQLLGTQPAPVAPEPFRAPVATPTAPLTNPFTGQAATHVVDVPEQPEPPSYSRPERFETLNEHAPAPRSAFIPATPEPEPEPISQPRPSVSSPARASRGSNTSSLGVQAHDHNPDQIVLRALLGTDDDLTPQRIVEMTCDLPGIAACVCLHGNRAISHVGARKPQAKEFQRQATDLAHHLKTLAPLIGIDGAETFTLTSGDRLMTFCFPEGAILGILHDAEPSLGLRDKITLIARELSRMLD